MSTYISSKKILSKVINLALLLSTTHFVLIEPVLAFEEDSIDLEEKFTEVSPENLSQDFEAMKGIAKETYEKTYENGSRIVEEVQAKIEDILNVDNIKTNRDAALSQAALEKTERKRIEEKVSKLEKTLDQEKTKLTNKEGKISQLKKKLKERKLAQKLLKKELEETKKKQADEISAARNFKAQTTQGLKNIEQTYKEIQTEREAFETKCQTDIANLKKEHAKETKTLSDEHSKILKQKNEVIADQKQTIDQFEQDQYNRFEQDRDFEDIRSYFQQKEINEVKVKHAEETKTLSDEHSKILKQKNDVIEKQEEIQANQKQKIDQFEQDQYNRFEQDRDFEDIRSYFQQKEINEVKAKHEEEIKTLSNEHSNILKQKNKVIANKEQLLTAQQAQIAKLTESLAAGQKDYNATQADIAKLKEEHAKEKLTLSKQLLDAQQGQVALLEESSTASQEDYNTAQEDLNTLRENDVQDQFSQSRELDTNSLDDVSTQEISPQTVDRGKSMSSVMNDSIEASANQLYDNISSRFSWNDHISSGDERGQVEIWVKQGAGVVSQKPTEQIKEGYKGRSHGLFIGIDRTFGLGDKNLIGAAIALNNKSKMQLRSSRGQLSTDSNIVSVYGKHHLNSQLALSGAVSYFRANTEAENFGENIDKIKMHGTRFDLELSYNKICGNQLWQPFVGASYSQISAFDINFKDQRVVIKTKKSRLLSGKIGTRVQLKQYSLENGINISPSLMASISKPLKIISGNRFMVNNNILSEDNNLLTHEIKDAMLNLGGDLRINRNNIDIIGSYNFSIRKKYQSHQGAIKVEVKL